MKRLRVHYAGWMGYQNLGDDLLWELFKENFEKYFDQNEYQLIPKDVNYEIEISDCDVFVLGGGSLLNQSFINLMHKGMKLKKEIILWGTGMDWIPQDHIQFLSAGDNQDFGINQLYSPEIQERLAEVIDHAKYAGVRGPLTYQYLKRMGAAENKLEICGDPGLILEQRKSNVNNETKINSNKQTIGVNWGTSFNYIYGGDELRVEEQLVRAIKSLIRMNYQIHIYMFWNRDEEACVRLFNKIGDKQNVFLDTKLYNKYQMLELLKNFYFTINFKLHANVMSHAAEIPFVPLGYRFKVFDYAKSVDMDRYLISTDLTDIDQTFVNHEKTIRAEYDTITKKLKICKEMYKQMVIKTFENKLFL